MSGTSADGIDAALVELSGETGVALKAFSVFPYPAPLRKRILAAENSRTPLEEIGELNVLIAEWFASAALKVMKHGAVDFIASHGQTLFHHPPSQIKKGETAFTMQIGDGSVIAQRTGILTVSDFRAADLAQGGEGAPLVPYVDWRLFTDARRGRVLLNLGGIANFTYLPPRGAWNRVVACDTGPANALLDALIARGTNGKQTRDEGGVLASNGKVNPRLLARLMRHPFLSRPLPKSADRSWFGDALAEKLLRGRAPLADLLATAAAFTAESVALHLARHAGRADEIYVSGGGEKNAAVVRMLRAAVEEKLKRKILVHHFSKLGLPGKAKEAVAFAFLGYETLRGRPSNLPNVTGARQACILGKISPGKSKWNLS